MVTLSSSFKKYQVNVSGSFHFTGTSDVHKNINIEISFHSKNIFQHTSGGFSLLNALIYFYNIIRFLFLTIDET